MFKNANPYIGRRLLASLLASSLSFSTALGQTAQSKQQAPASSAKPVAVQAPFENQPVRLGKHATVYYQTIWGVDSLTVKWAESGELIRFSYRVVDPEKAKGLNDKKAEPALIDPQARVKLVVPQMEKIGALRQSSTPEAGKSYWMAFSNSGRPVKRGDRVDVVIGQFRAEGLIVE